MRINECSRRRFAATRLILGNFAYDLYPNYEQIISGICHFFSCDKRIISLNPYLGAKFHRWNEAVQLIVQGSLVDPIDHDIDIING